jgi:hypothetical protein
MKHHLMVGTWTPPGAIFTVEFDDEAWTLKLVKRTAIPEDEPISWMTFDVSKTETSKRQNQDRLSTSTASTEEHLRSVHEEMVEPCGQSSGPHLPPDLASNEP